MPLTPKQERYLNRFYPGLIKAVEQLGAGKLIEKPPELHSTARGGLKFLGVRLLYKLDDGNEIDIRSSLQLRTGSPPYIPSDAPADLSHWQQVRYSLHYGPKFDDCAFRFDLDEESGYHVHMRPEPHDHIACDKVEPNTRHMHPLDFVAMVSKYRETGVYPVKKK